MRLFDFQVFEVITLFFSRVNQLHTKDVKFTKKMADYLTRFTASMKSQPPIARTRPMRTFPMTKKDLDNQNIKLIKDQRAQRELDKKLAKMRVIEE